MQRGSIKSGGYQAEGVWESEGDVAWGVVAGTVHQNPAVSGNGCSLLEVATQPISMNFVFLIYVILGLRERG